MRDGECEWEVGGGWGVWEGEKGKIDSEPKMR